MKVIKLDRHGRYYDDRYLFSGNATLSRILPNGFEQQISDYPVIKDLDNRWLECTPEGEPLFQLKPEISQQLDNLLLKIEVIA